MKQNRKATPPKKSHVHAAAGTRAEAASMALRVCARWGPTRTPRVLSKLNQVDGFKSRSRETLATRKVRQAPQLPYSLIGAMAMALRSATTDRPRAVRLSN
jgi:hypothetical protein